MTRDCPGLSMPQPPDAPPEGYVACRVAGHVCERDVAVEPDDKHGITIRVFCGCCGTPYIEMGIPWGTT